MRIVLNEKKLVELALDDGYIDQDNPSNTFKALIKYYIKNEMNKDEVKVALDAFMKNHFKDYNYNQWKDRVKKWVDKETKDPSPISNVEKVNVTQKELDCIKSIGNLDLEKVAFVYLVHSKIYNQLNSRTDYWVSSKMSDILKDAKVTKARTVKEQEALNRQLCDLGLLQYSYKVNLTNNRVCFVCEEDEVVIEISDFREFVLEYLKWKGERIGRCECGRLYKVNSSTHKYCKQCAEKNKTKQDRIADRKYKEKEKRENESIS